MAIEDLVPYHALLASHHHKEASHTSRRQRGTDDWLLIGTIGGLGRIGTNLGDLLATPGSLTLISPSVRHDYGTAKEAEGWEIRWVHFHPPSDWIEILAWPEAAPGVAHFQPENWEAIESAFTDVCELSVSTGARRTERSMNALERLLLLAEEQFASHKLTIDQRIASSIQFIDSNLKNRITLNALASKVHLSPSRFSHLFRAEIGLAPLAYASLRRSERARTLLERTTLSIAEVAAEVGMEPFHFSAWFKGISGLPPRDFRSQNS